MIQSYSKTRFRFACIVCAVFILAIMRPASYAAPGDMARASIASNGGEGNEESIAPAVSQNGRFIAFTSEATNFTTGDNNGFQDIYLFENVLPIKVFLPVVIK